MSLKMPLVAGYNKLLILRSQYLDQVSTLGEGGGVGGY
jgi:hypothetical protein